MSTALEIYGCLFTVGNCLYVFWMPRERPIYLYWERSILLFLNTVPCSFKSLVACWELLVFVLDWLIYWRMIHVQRHMCWGRITSYNMGLCSSVWIPFPIAFWYILTFLSLLLLATPFSHISNGTFMKIGSCLFITSCSLWYINAVTDRDLERLEIWLLRRDFSFRFIFPKFFRTWRTRKFEEN